MAVTETRELVIEATPKEILDIVADLESLPAWSSSHESVDVVERGEDGRPKVVKMKINTAGNADEQVVAYTWSDTAVSWTLISSGRLNTQDGTYTLTPEGDRTRLKFQLTVDPKAPVPGFLLKRVLKGSMETATDGLRKRVLKEKGQ